MYSLYDYSGMFSDKIRTPAYIKALESVITPDSIVIDLGAGSGIFSLIACQLGAKKVYAIEPSDCIQIGKELARANGCEKRIEWIQEDSLKVKLKEKADILFSDIRGVLPFIGENIAIIADARKRFLKEGGHLIPLADTLHIALVDDAKLFNDCTRPWTPNNHDLDLSPLHKRHTHQWRSATPKTKHLITEPQHWTTLDYRNPAEANITGKVELTAQRDGTVYGFYLWFDAELTPGIGFSGGPGKARPEVYGCGFFPWPEPVKMKTGDTSTIHLTANLINGDHIWRWRSDLSREQANKLTFDQSTFQADITSLAQLRKRGHSHIPQLSEKSTHESTALQLMDGKRPLETIAKKLMQKFPEHFTRYEEALAFAGNLSEKHSL